MQDFYKTNRLFCLCLVATVGFSIFLVHVAGFRGMVSQISGETERLRNVTFVIWDNYGSVKHGYLVFLSMDDFEKGIAYSNHSTLYLFFMYFLYKIELFLPSLPMRATSAFLEMSLLVAVIVSITSMLQKERIRFGQGVLFLLSIAFLVTMPGFWISAGKFNVDNPFHFYVPILLIVAFVVSRGIVSGPKLWLAIAALSLLAPIAAALLGLFFLGLSIRADGLSRGMLRLGVATIICSVLVYAQPVIVSSILGFGSKNSSWLFRSGLDGNVTYFSNVINSVIAPYFPRPIHLLLVPLALLSVQLLSMLKMNTADKASLAFPGGSNAGMFYQVLFSQYIIACLLWPQAVSIHPYLYDYLLLVPIGVWIVFNFFGSISLQANTRIWVLALLFLISFNLQQIAQVKKCKTCYYPAWPTDQLKLP
ncbi:hypothetical protein [Candidatus Accumulibacter sp. ACC003]|uniref:hypothetical protein n=1 Tax=Candidatus Accumulibacter sp. ACC003 TaxID=2823334 RepID=UPI0025BA8E43|nr:hypothetical protein [Candidatus Accumulibacter sp. ACC003]